MDEVEILKDQISAMNNELEKIRMQVREKTREIRILKQERETWLKHARFFLNDIETDLNEISEKSRNVECKICYNECVEEYAFDPCGHTVCNECKKDIVQCPFCRTAISKTLRIF